MMAQEKTRPDAPKFLVERLETGRVRLRGGDDAPARKRIKPAIAWRRGYFSPLAQRR